VPPKTAAPTATADPYKKIGAARLLKMHELMVRARLLEERLIKMSKGGDGFFWIGGPGEEAFNVPLGMQVKKGHGVDHDFLHLHYRSSAITLALGAKPIDALRQMRSVATDPYSKGRNFVNHYAIPEYNIVPVSPTIETQYSTAIGTGIAQARAKTDAVTIVNGGDAGTAEGDFHSCLVWANRPVLPLPILIIVVNNGWGISTKEETQHGEKNISDWAKVFPDMPGRTINGNDVAESWDALAEAFAYVRKNRKPYLLEARCSRLYGHSSSSGANRIPEFDCIESLEKALIDRGFAKSADLKKVWEREGAELDAAHQKVKQEPFPAVESVWENVFADGLPKSYPTKGGS
jgi:2-oxoisovalerate dehydrogenase E1 component alpha subunit